MFLFMTKNEIYYRIKELDNEIDLHVKVHHTGSNAGVLKLTNCEQYKDLMNERNHLTRLIQDKQYE